MNPLTPAKSTMIYAHGYDAASRTLAVHFRRNEDPSPLVHHYADVPPEVATQLQAAESPGRFFNEHVRGKFETTVIAFDRSAFTAHLGRVGRLRHLGTPATDEE